MATDPSSIAARGSSPVGGLIISGDSAAERQTISGQTDA